MAVCFWVIIRFARAISPNWMIMLRNWRILVVLSLAVLLFQTCVANAQSGRRKNVTTPTTAPTPVLNSAETEKPPVTEDETPSLQPSDVSISTLLVAGEIVHDNLYYKGNDLDNALKDCVRNFRDGYRPVNATKIGKLNFNDAKERAKKETDAYLLWISFVSKTDGYGNMRLDYAEYAILIPGTGKRLTNGRIKPNETSVVATGGILGLPQNRTRSSPISFNREMRDVVRQIPEILIHGGWLGR